MLSFDGSSMFRYHIVCSILSKRPITIHRIHADEDPPGIQPFEANFLKFIDRITNGSSIRVDHQNTELSFTPGAILGGVFSHDVPSSRAVTYIAEAAVLLMPFAKYDTKLTLVGCTQGDDDLCIDTFRTVTLRWVGLFGVSCSARVIRRGCAPGGNGAVELSCAAVRKLRSISVTERGRVKRIRGISFACKVAPDLPQRTATAAKGVLLQLLPDVYVVTDVDAASKRQEATSGYGVMLVAETTGKTSLVSQETCARAREAPEDAGIRCARLLLEQIFEGGCIDAHHQLPVLLLMALAPDEVSTARFGKLTPSGISGMVLMETFFGVTCAVKDEEQLEGEGLPPSTLVTCIGSNTVNIWKKSS